MRSIGMRTDRKSKGVAQPYFQVAIDPPGAKRFRETLARVEETTKAGKQPDLKDLTALAEIYEKGRTVLSFEQYHRDSEDRARFTDERREHLGPAVVWIGEPEHEDEDGSKSVVALAGRVNRSNMVRGPISSGGRTWNGCVAVMPSNWAVNDAQAAYEDEILNGLKAEEDPRKARRGRRQRDDETYPGDQGSNEESYSGSSRRSSRGSDDDRDTRRSERIDY